MAIEQLSRVLQTLCNRAVPREEAVPSDGQLLETYVQTQQEAAFAALVHRHGPMVWGVCRRILHAHQDAEDAFQATFLVLVRKAASVRPRELIANWLYGVASQTARKARGTNAKRHDRERQVTLMPDPALEPEPADDLRSLLDRELSRLPDKYRAVIALVSLRLQVDQKTVGAVNANGSGVTGTLKAVDAAAGSITVGDTPYAVARDALVVINGQPGPLAHLQVGGEVILTLRVDQKTVGMVQTK